MKSLKDTALNIYSFLVEKSENFTPLIKIKKDIETSETIRVGGASQFELLYERIQSIDNKLLTDEEILAEANSPNCSLGTLYEILSRRILSEENFSLLLLKIISKKKTAISAQGLLRISMRLSNKKWYNQILQVLSPLNVTDNSWLASCNAYKYENQSIEVIRVLQKATPKVKNILLKLDKDEISKILSLECESYKYIYEHKLMYFRALEATYFGVKLLPESLLREDSLLKMIQSQMRGVISSWVLSYQNALIDGKCFNCKLDRCVINRFDLINLESLLRSCNKGAVFLINHRLSNLFTIKILDALDIDFLVYANDGACFKQTIGNPKRLFCSSIWSDAEVLKKIKEHAKNKKIILTMTDPIWGGETHLHRTSNGYVQVDLHGFRLSKVLRLPLFFVSLIWDNMEKEYRLSFVKDESQNLQFSIENYIQSNQQDWLRSIEYEDNPIAF